MGACFCDSSMASFGHTVFSWLHFVIDELGWVPLGRCIVRGWRLSGLGDKGFACNFQNGFFLCGVRHAHGFFHGCWGRWAELFLRLGVSRFLCFVVHFPTGCIHGGPLTHNGEKWVGGLVEKGTFFARAFLIATKARREKCIQSSNKNDGL